MYYRGAVDGLAPTTRDQLNMKLLHDDEVGMMVEHCHSTRLVKTATQLYGLPHAKAKVKILFIASKHGIL